MRARSLRMQRTYRARHVIVAEQLAAFPVCQRCHAARAVDVHEIVSRGRGGSITDPSNTACLCRACHDLITREPALAAREGWSATTGAHVFVSQDGYFCDRCNLPPVNGRHKTPVN